MAKNLILFLILFFISSYTFAQISVTGTVSDAYGPIPGVQVLIKGTISGTITDIDGHYEIIVSDSTSILRFSYVGLKPVEISIDDQNVIDVLLQDAAPLEEHVVTALGSSLKKTKKYKNYATVRVFFGTDRNMYQTTDPSQMFGTRRSDVKYGMCEVSIPRDHRMGELEEPSIWKLEFYEDPEEHVVLLDVNLKSKNAFFSKLKKRINESPDKNAFIFVHGYNTSFEDAARRTAQMSYDLGFDGAPVFYSWPSQSSLLGYNVDQGNIKWSETNIENFLRDFLNQSNAQNVFLIAHSMGNRGLAGALTSIIAENPEMTMRIKEIILAAPDIDADIFKRDIAPILINGNHPITLYASSNDMALIASQKFSEAFRVGQSGDEMVIMPGIETIDASTVETDFLGHSYFGESEDILSDIFNIIHSGKRPGDRIALEAIMRDGQTYWKFKN